MIPGNSTAIILTSSRRLTGPNGWQSSLIAAANSLPAIIDYLENATEELLKATGVTLDSTEPERLSQLTSFCELLTEAYGIDLNFMFAPDATSRIESANKAVHLLKEIEVTKANLSVTYHGNSWQYVNAPQIRNVLDVADKNSGSLRPVPARKSLVKLSDNTR